MILKFSLDEFLNHRIEVSLVIEKMQLFWRVVDNRHIFVIFKLLLRQISFQRTDNEI